MSDAHSSRSNSLRHLAPVLLESTILTVSTWKTCRPIGKRKKQMMISLVVRLRIMHYSRNAEYGSAGVVPNICVLPRRELTNKQSPQRQIS